MPFLEHLMGLGTPPQLAAATAGAGTTGLVAVGSTSTDALQLSASWGAITTSSASTGVILPKATAGFCGYRNDSGQTITFYPGSGKTINAGSSSYTVATAKTALFFMTSATTWAAITTA